MSHTTRLQSLAVTSRSLTARVWGQPSGKVGSILTVLVVVFAVLGYFFAETLTGYSPTEAVGLPFETSGLFGTDVLGRSVAARFVAGGLALVWYSVLATAIGVLLGTMIGMLAASAGGILDWIIMRLNDVVKAFPQLIAALFVMVIFEPSGWVLVLVIGLTHACRVAHRVRAATLSATSQDYIVAARMYGMSRWQTLRREMLPNITETIAVEIGLRLTYSIGLIATLSFLGLGIQPPATDWAVMINENRFALASQPWGVVLPVIALALLTLGTHVLAKAIARAVDTSATHTK